MEQSQGHIGIVTSGRTSQDYAMLFASGGDRVIVYTDQDTPSAASYIKQSLERFQSQGLLKGNLTMEEQFDLISFSTNITDVVQGAKLVQECLEKDDLEGRQSLLKSVDDLVGEETIIVSSLTAILPSQLSQTLVHRRNFVVANHVDPLYYLPAMEVVPAPWTDPCAVTGLVKLLTSLGQRPAVLRKEVPGFLINRIQAILYREAYRLVHDEVITGQDCDVLMTSGIGLRYALMGQWEAVYLDASGMYNLVERYGDMVYSTQIDLKPALPMDANTLNIIERSVQSTAGTLQEIPERKKLIEEKIASLIKLKKDLDEKTDN